jgi:polyisoprenoid-binding protein YceI
MSSSQKLTGFARILVLSTGVGAGASLLLALPADAANLETIGAPEVRFNAAGPAGLAIKGSSDKLSGKQQGSSLVFTAPLTNLKTGIDLRDKHLRDYLETKSFPTAKLAFALDGVQKPGDNARVSGTRSADLTLHGVTKPVKVKYDAKRTGSDMHISGETQIDIRDFNVKVPCYLGVCVRPEVQIAVKFKMREK